MADETTTDTTAQTTSDATVQNTDTVQTSGAATDTAQQTQAQTQIDITQTPEFKAALTAAIEKKVPQLKRQIARDITGEKEGGATVEDLQRQLSERDTKLRQIEARESVIEYLSDARHKLNVKPDNHRAIVKLVMPDLEYDDEGKPSNIKDAIENAKSLAPALFANNPGSVEAGAGRNGQTIGGNDMNSLIRRSAGFGA